MAMNPSRLPVLYSFRRCPYAIRARLAIHASGQIVELREVVLRNKPQPMLKASPKGTVPVLVLPDESVLEESFDIMVWALGRSDPGNWLPATTEEKNLVDELVAVNDGPFKAALDRYKYPDRFDGSDMESSRADAANHLERLDALLGENIFLLGSRFTLADAAILPFVRQFAHVDRNWFYGQGWQMLIEWLDWFKQSSRFQSVMEKHKPWQEGDCGIEFGGDLSEQY
jgi:glutathione S-transferase